MGIGMRWGGEIPLIENGNYISIVWMHLIAELQNVHFILLGHIDPICKIFQTNETDLQDVARLFQFLKFAMFELLRFPKMILFFCFLEQYKARINGFGSHAHAH